MTPLQWFAGQVAGQLTSGETTPLEEFAGGTARQLTETVIMFCPVMLACMAIGKVTGLTWYVATDGVVSLERNPRTKQIVSNVLAIPLAIYSCYLVFKRFPLEIFPSVTILAWASFQYGWNRNHAPATQAPHSN